jgi:hypothetical protein
VRIEKYMAVKRRPAKRKTKRTVRRKTTAPPSVHIKREPVDARDVALVEGKGSPERGGRPGGYYWHIQVGDKRAGYIFINVIGDKFFGKHASVQIHLNENQRGKQIGRVAYRLACEQSGHDVVYAHMRKNNIASMRAAEEAGFKVIDDDRIPQRHMVWRRAAKA